MKTILFISLLFFSTIAFTQDLSSDRKVDWTTAGLIEAIPTPTTRINFITAGGNKDSLIGNDAVFTSILTSNTGELEIYFPNGKYLFKEPLQLRSNLTISGEDAATVQFYFDITTASHPIQAIGTSVSDTLFFSLSPAKEDSSINFTSSELDVDDWVEIIDEDTMNLNDVWARFSTGQLISIKEKTSTKTSFNQKLRRDYSSTRKPFLKKFSPLSNIHINKISVYQNNSYNSQVSNIYFKYVINSKINCISSYSTNFAHVELNKSNNIEVSGSYFQDGQDYGNGGRAYGIVPQFLTGECLIENNIFNHLRHAILVQAGANGNVFSYNYSVNNFWTGTALPSDASGDLVLHGNYPYANLFEGNIGQHIVIDNSHGLNGKRNTFLRNRSVNYGLFMNTNPASSGQNFLGNEITDTRFFRGNYILEGDDHFEYGNIVRSTLTPSSTTEPNDSSLYNKAQPNFWDNNLTWPPIGIEANYNQNSIPSKNRFDNNEKVYCSSNTVGITKKAVYTASYIFPNPAKETIKHSIIKSADITIYNLIGEIVLKVQSFPINIESLENGIYFLKIDSSLELYKFHKL